MHRRRYRQNDRRMHRHDAQDRDDERDGGGVDAAFDGENLKCTVGGTGKGALTGTQLIEATKGGRLEVVVPEWRQAGGTARRCGGDEVERHGDADR